jgi:thioredoxin reductase (NADPH)
MADPKNENMFPRLDAAQMARIEAFGKRRNVNAGETLWEIGQANLGVFVLIQGSIEILGPSGVIVTVHEPGEFSGEVNLLSGRPSVVRGRTRVASEVIEIDPANLRRLIQTEAELSEILLRAYVLRRAYLIANSVGDVVLAGSSHSADTLRLRGFLTRNGFPHTYIDVDRDAGIQELFDHFEVGVEDIPVLICGNRNVLRNPTNAEVAACLGLNTEIDHGTVYDVVIAGAGPSGLAAAVYAASEGLNVVALECNAPGGQAGSSSRIENYLGFPAGVSGQELTDRALLQSQKFGAQVNIACSAAGLDCAHAPFAVRLSTGGHVHGRSIVIATGAAYRKLLLPNLARFEGVGIYYGATHVEAQLCQGEEVAIVGGGNSAGQAAVYLATHSKHVHLLVRGAGLSETMSRYLIRRIEEHPGITLRAHTEVEAVDGNGELRSLRWRDSVTGEVETREIGHLFVMTGARPNTAWLSGCLALDEKQFVKTGQDLTPENLASSNWPLQRAPYLLETSRQRVFAVGDVRSGSVKRVASAVGEGSIAIQLVHKVLAE